MIKSVLLVISLITVLESVPIDISNIGEHPLRPKNYRTNCRNLDPLGLFFYRRLDIGCGKISASMKVGNGEDVFGQLQLKPVLHTGRLRRKSRDNHKPRNINTDEVFEKTRTNI